MHNDQNNLLCVVARASTSPTLSHSLHHIFILKPMSFLYKHFIRFVQLHAHSLLFSFNILQYLLYLALTLFVCSLSNTVSDASKENNNTQISSTVYAIYSYFFFVRWSFLFTVLFVSMCCYFLFTALITVEHLTNI